MVDTAQRTIARQSQRPNAKPAAEALEVVEVALEQPEASRALVGLVRDELDHDRPAGERRPCDRSAEHARRVYDVGVRRPLANPGRDTHMSHSLGSCSIHPAHLVRLLRGLGFGSRHDLDGVPARE